MINVVEAGFSWLGNIVKGRGVTLLLVIGTHS